MIQIRNVPETLHRELKARAAMQGMTLSDYLLRTIKDAARTPSIDELRARLAKLTPVIADLSPEEIIRAERDRL